MQRYITMSRFGRSYGRWSNQLLQYAFLQCYARQHNLAVQLPPWVGNELLGVRDWPVTVRLPPINEQREKGSSQGIPPTGDELVGYDFHGQAQYHTSYYRPHREFIRGLWRPTVALCRRMLRAELLLSELGQTRIGIHLRRGDYGRLIFYITPVQWYLAWLKVNWPRFDNPVLFVASEDRALVDEFREYNPQTAESLGVDLKTEPLPTYPYLPRDLREAKPHLLDFFPDWHLLAQCDVLVMGNSTFAFTAAMVARHLQECWRSRLSTQQFEQIDPWDSLPLLREDLRDYPRILGTFLTQNPMWR